MKLRLLELQAEDSQARKIRSEKLGRNWQDSNRILHYQGMPYIFEIIKIELISKYYHIQQADYFGIKKIPEFVARKYYCKTLRHNIEVYVKGCDICLMSKAVRHKSYRNL